MNYPRKTIFKSPWFSLVSKKIPNNSEPFYALKLADYVTVFAVTPKDEILLISQLRPAIEKRCLELPSGHVDKGETPLSAAHRELLEETGYKARKMTFLGCLYPDVGRMSNRLWCYYSKDLVRQGGLSEAGITVHRVSKRRFEQKVRNGSFSHALNLAVLALAVFKGKW